MKTVIRYSINEFGFKGSCYSRPIFRQVVERARALRIVKRLRKSGRDIVACKMTINV